MTTQRIVASLGLLFLMATPALAQETASLEDRITALELAEEERSGLEGMVSIHGVLAYAYQAESATGPANPGDPDGWSIPFQPEISVTPTERDEIFFKMGWAAGKGLNDKTNFTLAPWASDHAFDVVALSGGSRDHLLTAWYKHTFEFSDDHRLGLTGGIIDATDYLDQNAYSNDEYTQFMNEALVNAPNAFLPSYEPGAALEWSLDWFSVNGAFVESSENHDGRAFTYFGVQLMATANPKMGQGHYRLIYNRTSQDFSDPTGSSYHDIYIYMLSCDQEITDWLGAWIRFGNQDSEALTNYERILSGGLQFSGSIWGRGQDALGVGYGDLKGTEQTDESLSHTSVFEAYLRFGLNDHAALTLDAQRLEDRYVDTATDGDVSGWIIGARMTVEF